MTPAQNRRYWKVWGQVKALLTGLGEFSKEDAEDERKAIHREVLGSDKSSKDFSNKDLDRVIQAFEERLVLLNGPVAGDRAVSQPVKRLLWAIDQLGLDAAYIEDIASDQFGTTDWRSLPEDKLSKFRFTLTKRARAKKKKKVPEPEPDDGDDIPL